MVQIGESVASGGGGAGDGSDGEDDDESTTDETLVKLLLHDAHVEPMPSAWYLLRAAGEERRARANEAGVLLEQFTRPVEECRVFWSPGSDPQPGSERDFRYDMTVYVHIRDGDASERTRKRLHNLGWPFETGDAEAKDAALRSLRAGWRIKKLTDGLLASVHRRPRVKPSV
jgi:hypothetical protein